MKNLARKLPLVGGLCDSRKPSITSAAKEIIFSTVFSTFPIWLFPLFYAVFFVDSPGFLSNVTEAVSQGDLYIYSSSLIGPLLFAITFNYMSWGTSESLSAPRIGKITIAFPHGTAFLIISVFVLMLAVLCFGFARFESAGIIKAKLNKDSLLLVSVATYIFSLFSLFVASIYRNDLTSSISDPTGERELSEKWRNRDA